MKKEEGTAAAEEKPGKELTEKQKLFCDAMLDYGEETWFNATRSYQKVYGVGYDVAKSAGPRLFANVCIREHVAERSYEMRAKAGIHTEKTLQEVARMAYFSPRAVLNKNGTLKHTDEIDDDAIVGIAGLDIEALFAGKGEDREQIGNVIKVKFADKLGALDKLMKIDNMITEKTDNEPKGDVIFNITGFGGKNLMSSKKKA